MTPTDAQWLPNDDTRTYTASVGDADEVVIALADATTVTVDGGIVSFEEDAGNEGFADLGAANAGVTAVDGVLRASTPGPITVAVIGGELSFTITGDNSDGLVLPVVYVENAETGNEVELQIDADGEPTVDFGIGGITGYVDITPPACPPTPWCGPAVPTAAAVAAACPTSPARRSARSRAIGSTCSRSPWTSTAT